jgi:hypothetical protein
MHGLLNCLSTTEAKSSLTGRAFRTYLLGGSNPAVPLHILLDYLHDGSVNPSRLSKLRTGRHGAEAFPFCLSPGDAALPPVKYTRPSSRPLGW